MTREWKPGDVADLHGTRVVRHPRREGHWTYPDGSSGPDFDGDARPLVVLDPEDREQVERLAAAYAALGSGFAELMDEPWSMPAMRLRQALREFADPKPPKPAEPTGLGAVVEATAYTDEIRPFVRTAAPLPPWHDDSGNGHAWNELDVVRVLAEGVTS